jgi:hypothetical protein
MVERSGAGCSGPLNHENAAILNAGRFQHLQGTLSISFGIRRGRVSGVLENVSRGRYSQSAGDA